MKSLAGKICLVVFILSNSVCFSQQGKSKVSAKGMHDTTGSKWKYEEKEDKMSPEKKYFAEVLSDDSIDGGILSEKYQHVTLCIRNEEGKSEVMLYTDNILFDCDAEKGTTYRMRFDNEEPSQYLFTPATEGQLYAAFINPASEVIEKIKHAEKLVVEVSFLLKGTYQLTFNVHSLVWNHADKSAENSNDLKVTDAMKHWRYFDTTDAMTSEKQYDAFAYSKAPMDYKPAYNTEAYASFFLYYNGSENYFSVRLDKGAFNTKDDSCRVRFDNNKPAYYKVYFRGSEYYYIMGFYKKDTLISLLKKAKKMLIEVDIDKVGKRLLEFDVEGLKWNHKNINTGKTFSGSAPVKKPTNNQTPFYVHNSTANPPDSSSASGNDFKVLSTDEEVDINDGNVTLVCKCRNTGKGEKSVKIKGYFMDDTGKVLSIKEVSVECTGNMSLTTRLTASGIARSYKKFKIEIE
jgi:hypothetical protein